MGYQERVDEREHTKVIRVHTHSLGGGESCYLFLFQPAHFLQISVEERTRRGHAQREHERYTD